MEEEASNKIHPSLPANYVTLVDLRERWMQQQKQKNRHEGNGDDELQPNFEVRGDVVAEGEKSLLRSNPNPNSATRRPSHAHRRPIETRNGRWIQVSQPIVLPLESAEVESSVEPCGETRTCGKMVDDRGAKKKQGVLEQPNDDDDGDGDDHTRAEIEGKFVRLSLSSGTGVSSGGRSMALRDRGGLRKEKAGGGGYGKCEARVMLQKERPKRGLVWVVKKRGEASEIGAVPMGGN